MGQTGVFLSRDDLSRLWGMIIRPIDDLRREVCASGTLVEAQYWTRRECIGYAMRSGQLGTTIILDLVAGIAEVDEPIG